MLNVLSRVFHCVIMLSVVAPLCLASPMHKNNLKTFFLIIVKIIFGCQYKKTYFFTDAQDKNKLDCLYLVSLPFLILYL
jgi:hypothetical protein